MNKITRFTETSVLNSITNSKSTTYDDSTSPYTLLEWLERTNNTGNADTKVQQYNNYLKEWRSVSNQTDDNNNTSIRNVYVRFLKELTLNYTTEEEKRFLKNVDLSSDIEIDAALSFFATRIREIIENIYQNRHQLSFQKTKHSWKGTKHGIDRSIYDALIKHAISIKKTDLTKTINNTKIIFRELYDTNQTYFDSTYQYTPGGEFLDSTGSVYTGYYHVHLHEDGSKLYMAGKKHTPTPHQLLTRLNYQISNNTQPVNTNTTIYTSSNSSY